MSVPYLAHAADQQQIEWIGGGRMSVLFDAEATAGQLSVLRSHLPQGAAAPVHVHSDEDEMFIVLKGSAVFWAGDQRYELSDGGVAFLPRHVPHAYHFTSDVDLLTLCTPAGIEAFFRAAGWDVSQPKPDGWALTPAAMATAAAAHGQKILGPPLGPGDMIPAPSLG